MAFDLERDVYRAAQPAAAGSLFETFADKALRRLDDVVRSRDCALPVPDEVRDFLLLLRPHQGQRRAVPLGRLAEKMHRTPRAIKEIVRDCRMHFGVMVCSSRAGDGYWLAATVDEVIDAMHPYFAQAVSELRLYHAMVRDARSVEQTLHQIRLALTEDGASLQGDAHV